MNIMNMREIVERMNDFQQRMLEGESVSVEELDEIDAKFEDKVDAIAHILDRDAARIEWYKIEIKRLQTEIKRMQNNQITLKKWMAFCIDKLGLKNVTTRFHRVFVRNTPYKAEYDMNDKELETIDNRCIEYIETKRVSKSRALEIFKNSNGTDVPEGFKITRGRTVSIK